MHTFDEAALVAALTDLFARALAGKLNTDFLRIARIRPEDGAVSIDRETSWCVSEDERKHRAPHALSLRIERGEIDFSEADPTDFDADELAQALVDQWREEIEAWVAAGAEQSLPAFPVLAELAEAYGPDTQLDYVSDLWGNPGGGRITMTPAEAIELHQGPDGWSDDGYRVLHTDRPGGVVLVDREGGAILRLPE